MKPRIHIRLRRRAVAAFTLVEVMLALAIFSAVLISIYETWSAIMRGTKLAIDATAAVQRSRVTVRAIEDALNTAQFYAGNESLYHFIADKQGEFAVLDMVAKLPETFPGSGLYGDLRLRRVRFAVNAKKELMLYQWPLLTPDQEAAPESNDESNPSDNKKYYFLVLGRKVDLFRMDYWDPRKKDWVDEWTPTNSFPPLVRVAIGMGNAEGLPVDKREIITRLIAPAAIKVPREYQQPGVVGRPGVMPTNIPPIDPRMMVPPPILR